MFLDTERGLDTFGYGWIRLSTFLDTVGYDHRFFGYGQNFGYGWIRLDTIGYVWIRLDTLNWGLDENWIRLDTFGYAEERCRSP